MSEISGLRDALRRKAKFLPHVLLAVLACAPALLASRVQRKNWVAIPIWDEWDTPGQVLLRLAQHALSWRDLFAQHNESRKLVPRLIYMAMAEPLGWDVRHGMILTLLCFCAASLLALRYLAKAGGVNKAVLAAWCFINFMLFGPGQYENLLCGNAFEILIPALCVLGVASVNLSTQPLWAKTGWNALLAAVATYSFAHGIMLWLLAVPLPSRQELHPPQSRSRLLGCYAAYAVSAFLAVGGYFVDYHRPAIAPPAARFQDAAGVLRFFLVWLGGNFRSSNGHPYAAGTIVALIGLFAVAAVARALCRNPASWQRYYPWILVGAFSVGSGLITAVGRVKLGVDAIFAPGFDGIGGFRYNLTSVFVTVAVTGLMLPLWREAAAPTRRLLATAATCCAILMGFAWWMTLSYETGRVTKFRQNRLSARSATIWAEVLPNDRQLFAAYPYLAGFAERLHAMKAAGLIRLPGIGEGVKQAIARPPLMPANGGAVEESKPEGARLFRIAGWARDPRNNAKPEYVVLAWSGSDEVLHPFTAIRTTERRPDLVPILQTSSLPSLGFSTIFDASNLPPGPVAIRGWSIDRDLRIAFPLEGAAELNL